MPEYVVVTTLDFGDHFKHPGETVTLPAEVAAVLLSMKHIAERAAVPAASAASAKQKKEIE